jgi:hypothetical protein
MGLEINFFDIMYHCPVPYNGFSVSFKPTVSKSPQPLKCYIEFDNLSNKMKVPYQTPYYLLFQSARKWKKD